MPRGFFVYNHDSEVAPNPDCCSDAEHLCANCARLVLNENSDGRLPEWYPDYSDDEYSDDEDILDTPVLSFDDEEDDEDETPAYDRGSPADIGYPARGSGSVAANNELVANGIGSRDCLIEPVINFKADAAARAKHSKRCACQTTNQVRKPSHNASSPHPTLLIPPTMEW